MKRKEKKRKKKGKEKHHSHLIPRRSACIGDILARDEQADVKAVG